MSIRSRRNSLLKSSISIKSMRDTVSNFTNGITNARKTATELVRKTRESNVFKKRLVKSGQKVKINQHTKGIEVEVYYFIKKSFFDFKGKVTKSNVTKFIKFMGPCFEIVGFRQRNKKFTYLGDICGDFGFNIKFVVGRKTKFKKLNLNNLKTSLIISSTKILSVARGKCGPCCSTAPNGQITVDLLFFATHSISCQFKYSNLLGIGLKFINFNFDY